jgi:hypothetical protein
MQSGSKQPLRELNRFDVTEYRTHQALKPLIQFVFVNDSFCPFPVSPRGDYEFDLVSRFQNFQVRPEVPVRFTTVGTFQIEDDVNAFVHGFNIVCATRFQKHGSTRIGQFGHEWEDFRLKQGLAAGEFDERAIEGQRSLHYCGAAHSLAVVECVRRIAPLAPEIADGTTNKDAWQTGECRFTLNTLVYLVDQQLAWLDCP